MSSESSDHRAPPELNFTVPERSKFGKNKLEWSNEKIREQIPTDILLITANENEFATCYEQMENVQRSSYKDETVDFGKFKDNQDVKVALIKCEQGSKPALITVKNAAEILRPKAVLAVGICASMEPKKAKLGDVVISAKLASYAHTKKNVDGTVEYRDPIVPLGEKMRKLIKHADASWEPPLTDPSESKKITVHREHTMLSGPELINNLERRQELKKAFPNALGLEMEGDGVYPAAKDLDIEWAVIKAVSDYADGNKDKTEAWQPFSSAMAASLVRNMFKNADIKNWRHYENNDPRVEADDGKRSRQEESSNKDETDTKRPRLEERSNEDEPALRMCNSCHATNENQLSNDRNKWPVGKIESSFFYHICELLDDDSQNSQPLPIALGFTQQKTNSMIRKFSPNGGIGLTNDALGKWGAADVKNNVGALKDIVDHKIGRNDVRRVIEKWEKLGVCHGCGIKWPNN